MGLEFSGRDNNSLASIQYTHFTPIFCPVLLVVALSFFARRFCTVFVIFWLSTTATQWLDLSILCLAAHACDRNVRVYDLGKHAVSDNGAFHLQNSFYL